MHKGPEEVTSVQKQDLSGPLDEHPQNSVCQMWRYMSFFPLTGLSPFHVQGLVADLLYMPNMDLYHNANVRLQTSEPPTNKKHEQGHHCVIQEYIVNCRGIESRDVPRHEPQPHQQSQQPGVQYQFAGRFAMRHNLTITCTIAAAKGKVQGHLGLGTSWNPAKTQFQVRFLGWSNSSLSSNNVPHPQA
jgi:hypothetical protein